MIRKQWEPAMEPPSGQLGTHLPVAQQLPFADMHWASGPAGENTGKILSPASPTHSLLISNHTRLIQEER